MATRSEVSPHVSAMSSRVSECSSSEWSRLLMWNSSMLSGISSMKFIFSPRRWEQEWNIDFLAFFRRTLSYSTKEPVYREEEEAFLSWFVTLAVHEFRLIIQTAILGGRKRRWADWRRGPSSWKTKQGPRRKFRRRRRRRQREKVKFLIIAVDSNKTVCVSFVSTSVFAQWKFNFKSSWMIYFISHPHLLPLDKSEKKIKFKDLGETLTPMASFRIFAYLCFSWNM